MIIVLPSSIDFNHPQQDISSVSSYISGIYLQFNSSKCRQDYVYVKKECSFLAMCLSVTAQF